MKKIFNYILLGAIFVGASSCEKYLDINENPNSFTSATPELVLPQAIVGSAAITSSFNTGLADIAGQRANGGGFGGFGDVVTYQWTATNGTYSGLWTSSYDNLNDYEYVIEATKSDPKLAYSTAMARIMKSMGFARLVDQFNDIPYSEALKGNKILTPKFDKGQDVYQDLVKQLDSAMIAITAAQANPEVSVPKSSADPMFKGDMDRWKRYANTLKLRLLVRMAGVPELQAFTGPAFASFDTSIGFLTADAVVNPGYEKTTRPNPTYNALGYATDGATTQTSRIPTKWMYSFYNGVKLTDPYRGKAVYRSFPSAIVNQLGDESADVPKAPASGSSWSVLADNNDSDAIGITKGPAAGQIVMTAAESYFLQAEAYERGYLSGNAQAAFDNGIVASFNYLYKDATNTVPATMNVATDVAAYKAANNTSYLVNYELAASQALF